MSKFECYFIIAPNIPPEAPLAVAVPIPAANPVHHLQELVPQVADEAAHPVAIINQNDSNEESLAAEIRLVKGKTIDFLGSRLCSIVHSFVHSFIYLQ